MFSKVRGVITQQHVLQGTWLDKFTCWSADKVSRGQSCSYGGHRNDVLLGLSSRPRQLVSALPLVGLRKHGPWSARISDACSSVWRQIVSGMRKFCPLTNCRRQQELLPHRSVKHREEKLLSTIASSPCPQYPLPLSMSIICTLCSQEAVLGSQNGSAIVRKIGSQ